MASLSDKLTPLLVDCLPESQLLLYVMLARRMHGLDYQLNPAILEKETGRIRWSLQYDAAVLEDNTELERHHDVMEISANSRAPAGSQGLRHRIGRMFSPQSTDPDHEQTPLLYNYESSCK